PAVLRLREHIAERNVRQIISVIIDVEAVDCVGMKCVRIGTRIEDDHGSVLIGWRLECVQITEVESLIAQRRTETKSSEMVRHCTLLFTRISIFRSPRLRPKR